MEGSGSHGGHQRVVVLVGKARQADKDKDNGPAQQMKG